jgi:hypothetical protein
MAKAHSDFKSTQGYIGLVGETWTERMEERLWGVTEAAGYKNPVQTPLSSATAGNDEDEETA